MNRLVSPKTLSKARRKLPQALSVRFLTFGVATPYYRDVFDDSRAKWTHWQDSFNKNLGILADRIVAGSVVAYVGAGPSIASRKGRKQVPGWKALCNLLLDWANRDYPKLINDQVGTYLKRLIEKIIFRYFAKFWTTPTGRIAIG